MLYDQNRALWDQLLIHRGVAALDRARILGGMNGPYVLQAAIAGYCSTAPPSLLADWRRPRYGNTNLRVAGVHAPVPSTGAEHLSAGEPTSVCPWLRSSSA